MGRMDSHRNGVAKKPLFDRNMLCAPINGSKDKTVHHILACGLYVCLLLGHSGG